MRSYLIILFLLVLATSCKKEYSAPVPDFNNWPEFNSGSPLHFSASQYRTMEGVYDITAGNDIFGETVAVKWSYVNTGTDTTFHFSIFCGKNIAYFICEGKKSNGDLLLNGYWRKMDGVETGIARLTIKAAQGGDFISSGQNNPAAKAITITGVFGTGQALPTSAFSCTYNRPLFQKTPFLILANRGGGRNSDLLPVSENSVAMLRKTAEMGGQGVEIDIRYTKDGVPVLYHDATINLRETQKSGLLGPVENYTYAQLSAFVRLIHGEKIPTVKEALDAVLYQTDLRFVWLDNKVTDAPQVSLRALQKEYLAKAAAAGRHLEIVLGIPDEPAKQQFLALPDHADAPSICEISVDEAAGIKAANWAPRFTLGIANEDVAKAHNAGIRAFVWTIDVPELVQQYLKEGHFDSILSNYPSIVAYYYYVQQ